MCLSSPDSSLRNPGQGPTIQCAAPHPQFHIQLPPASSGSSALVLEPRGLEHCCGPCNNSTHTALAGHHSTWPGIVSIWGYATHESIMGWALESFPVYKCELELDFLLSSRLTLGCCLCVCLANVEPTTPACVWRAGLPSLRTDPARTQPDQYWLQLPPEANLGCE